MGRKGLELILEDKLRGIDGAKIYIEKKDGEEGDTIAEQKAKNGQDFQLAIDTKVQKSLYKQMKNDPGAASAIDPKTGDILALVSTPSFNPNDFVLGISGDQYKKLSNNPDKPLLTVSAQPLLQARHLNRSPLPLHWMKEFLPLIQKWILRG